MKIIDKVSGINFPFEWVNLSCYKDSKANRVEIYLKEDIDDFDTNLIHLFNSFFKRIENEILIYDKSWWNLTLDTWNIETDEYDYALDNKSDLTQKYMRMLLNSDIEVGYSGVCKCNDWDNFLKIILPTIRTHIAPYSPIFFNIENDFFFYFHHTGSIGLYYKEENKLIRNILKVSGERYILQ